MQRAHFVGTYSTRLSWPTLKVGGCKQTEPSFQTGTKAPNPQNKHIGQRCQGVTDLAGGNTVWGCGIKRATSHVLESSAWAYWFCHHSKAALSPLGTSSACGMILSKSKPRLDQPHNHTCCVDSAVWGPEFSTRCLIGGSISLDFQQTIRCFNEGYLILKNIILQPPFEPLSQWEQTFDLRLRLWIDTRERV